MDKLLIVEDETLIRQGLRAIIQRSGVPVGEILECTDGVQAMALLAETPVDVMFTDVRMPEMDGLTLIRRLQELPADHRPLVVVISGHDDFNYAVEAMRYGSKEYILKPVKRERVREVLEKLELEIASQREENVRTRAIGHQQLKYVLINANITERELETIQDTFKDLLTGGPYVLYCTGRPVALEEDSTATRLDAIGPFSIFIHSVSGKDDFSQKYMEGAYAGISAPHSELREFRTAFAEAIFSRKHAFFTSKGLVERVRYPGAADEGPAWPDPEQLARKIGTSQYATLVQALIRVFSDMALEKVESSDFEAFIERFLAGAAQLYSGQMAERDGRLAQLKQIYGFDTVDVYRLGFMEWLDKLHTQVAAESDNLRNRERMEAAVAYIQENYGSDLNMATVSNHVSVNYSQFSSLFKEHTGQPFSDYLRRLRIDKAKQLLAGTEMRIGDVSGAVGYDDEKYFMKTFKALVGVSPSQYRKSEHLAKR